MKNKALIALCSLVTLGSFSADNWKGSFKGDINFSLRDDRRLMSLIEEEREVSSGVEDALKRHSRIEREFNLLKRELQNVISRIQKSREEIDFHRKSVEDYSLKIQKKESENSSLKNNLSSYEQDFGNLKGKIRNIEVRMERLKKKLTQTSKECSQSPTPHCESELKRAKRRVEKLQEELEPHKMKLAKLKEDKTRYLNLINANDKVIARLRRRLEDSKNNIVNSKRSLEEQKRNKDIIRPKVSRLSQSLEKSESRLKDRQDDLQIAGQEKRRYRRTLIGRILEVNEIAFSRGSGDGGLDGRELAKRIGHEQGESDGNKDGHRDGTNAGKSRDYNQGHLLGQKEGENRAKEDGKKEGETKGTRDGNKIAAREDSTSAGINDAKNSDAELVGKNAGIKEGHRWADVDGSVNGNKKGESQAIHENEKNNLPTVKVGGDFAGTFSKSTPSFPYDHKGSSYGPRDYPRSYGRELVRKAYVAGYIEGYERLIQREFNREISSYYSSSYDYSYERKYDQSYGEDYPISRSNGKKRGYDEAYKKYYPGYFQVSYEEYKNQYKASPNKKSKEYKETYSTVYQQTYQNEYEKIKGESLTKFKDLTYNQTIDKVTESYRSKRFLEVQKVYDESAVLKYKGLDIHDGGTNSVGGGDGIYMPLEDVIYDVVLTNYGKKAAHNVQLVLKSGKVVSLPSVPALSNVVIKGGAKEALFSSEEKQKEELSISVKFNLTKERKIQGRHFEKLSENTLLVKDSKTVITEYPLAVSSFSLESELEFNKENTLSLSLLNKGSRSYDGPIELSLSSNMPQVIKEGFKNVDTLNSTITKKAKILVRDQSDLYTDIKFSVQFKKKGVLIGYSKIPVSAVAKMPFSESPSGVAILANGVRNERRLMNLIDELGGMKNVGVIDVGLESTKAILENKGVKNTAVIVLPGGTKDAFNKLLKNSMETSFVYGNVGRDFDSIQNNMSSLQKSFVYTMKLGEDKKETKVVMTNKNLNKSLKSSNIIVSLDESDILWSLPLAKTLSLSNDKIIAEISKIAPAQYVNKNEPSLLVIQGATIRSLHENLAISKEYRNSGGAFSRDKNIAKRVKKDSRLLHNRVLSAIKKSANSGNLSNLLFGYDLYFMLESAFKVHGKMSKRFASAVNDRLFGGSFKSGILKPLKLLDQKVKNVNRSIYKQMKRNVGSVAPFEFEQYEDDHFGNEYAH